MKRLAEGSANLFEAVREETLAFYERET